MKYIRIAKDKYPVVNVHPEKRKRQPMKKWLYETVTIVTVDILKDTRNNLCFSVCRM